MGEEEVVAKMGAGGDRRVFEDGDVHLGYDAEGITLFFGIDDGGVLDGMEVDAHCHCTIWGERPWLLSRLELLRLISKKGGITPGDLDLLARIGSDGECGVALRNLSLDFYIGESGLVSSINWGVIVDDSDEVVWPDAAPFKDEKLESSK